MTTPAPRQMEESITGDAYDVIEGAVAVLERVGEDVRRYVITVVDDRTPVVIFQAAPLGSAGDVIAVRAAAAAPMTSDDLREVRARTENRDDVARLKGLSFPPVRVAVGVFRTRLPSLAPYRITVIREEATVSVIFTDKEGGNSRIRGAPGTRPGFEVELDVRDLRVMRSNFIR